MDEADRPVGRLRLGLRCGHVAAIAAPSLARLAFTVAVGKVTRRDATPALAKILPHLLPRLGPFYVKGGQLLSTRHDLIPRELCEALGSLTDRVPPPAQRGVERAVAQAYADLEQSPYVRFDWSPVASGSIASVHRAFLADGTQVAVKVRRPGIARLMRMDLRLALAGARMAQKLPSQRGAPAEEMVGQVGGAILGQLDFVGELRALQTLRANLAAVPAVRLPEPYAELSREGVVAMEFLEGLQRFRPGDLPLEARRDVVRTILKAVFRMLFLDGIVHCDLHPGNLYLNRAGSVVILDAGFVVRLPDTVRGQFAEFFKNMALGKGERCAEVVYQSAARVPDAFDRDGFTAAVVELVEEADGAVAKDFSLLEFAPRLFRIQRGFGLYAAAEFAFPLLSLLVLEGMIKDFDADVDFQAEAMPVLYTALTTPALDSAP
jgi:ubiquinone biosynthesis protein